jgi:cyclase
MRSLSYWKPVLALVVVTVAVASSAQNIERNTHGNEGMTAQYVKTGLYLISGKGGNSVLRLSANGLILVDGKLPGSYDGLMRQVRTISKQPVRALILTSCNEPRTGTNAQFLEHGTPIVVQENAKSVASCHSGPDATAVPIVNYASEYQIHLGGVDVQLKHFGNAYSSDDTVVYFPNLKAVAVGQLYPSNAELEVADSGNLLQWSSVLADVLKLDFDTVVPATGPIVTRSDFVAFKAKIDGLLSRASALVKKGVPKDQFVAALNTGDVGLQVSLTPSQLDHIYAELLSTQVANR